MEAVYENVIVAFDGSGQGRAALAPGGDLAWRCGAKIVIVNNTDASDRASREALKTRAMSLSGADVDFWVDLDHTLGRALVEAAKFRPNPIVCISVKGKPGGLLKGKRFTLPPLGEEVIRDSPVPVLIIGQETDTSRGLPLTEIVVSTDGSPAAEEVFAIGADMARDLKLIFTLVGVVHESSGDTTGELKYLEEKAESLRGRVPEVRHELIKAPDPATGLIEFMEHREDAILAMSTHGRSGVNRSALGSVALKVVGQCKRAVLVRRPA
jgi:nucleotide-binding universal stress UspA family protein